MGYEGARISLCVREMYAPTRRAGERMADAGGKRMRELVEMHTPVDTGHLKESWKQKVVLVKVTERGVVWSSGAETHVDYAEFVEHGTGLWGPKHAKYLIVPKKPGGVLHWISPEGADVFATRVWHPGSPGAHMMAIAVAETEAAFAAIVRPALELWAVEAERAFARGGRIKVNRL